MKISDETVEKLLKRFELVSDERIAEIKEDAERSKQSLRKAVVESGAITDQVLTKTFAEYTGVPFVELEPKELSSELLLKIPERIARQYMAVVFAVDDKGVHHLAMEDPDDVQAVNFIQKELGEDTKIHIATRDNILACLENYRGDVSEEINQVIEVQTEKDEDAPVASEADVAENSPIAKTVNLLLEYAIKSSASDVHIEPREEYVQVRYRIDGALKEVNRLPKNVLGALVSRVKILANLKIDERRVPQDGRFKIKVTGRQYALRVSTLPIADGEKIVMRVLNESNQSLTLESLGYWGQSIQTMHEAIAQPNGMILVTGPTGSGKSTSLFSVLSMLNQPDVNISTIEDPVEYKIPGVNQTQTNVKAGMTFANGLRALLRQDPNIIMVGEIRDGETANLGVQAALTGHLVFSTLHTNNAATTLPRLLDMEIEPFLISSTVKAVVGQRLVRRLCVHCRQQYGPERDEIEAFTKLLGIGKDNRDFSYVHQLEQAASKEGVGTDTPLGTNETTIASLWRANPEGCDECNHTGFRGRIGIYEVLGVSREIQKMIMAGATSNQIQDQAIKDGMITMQTDGLVKSLRGNTTVEEVLNVTRE